MHDPIGCGNYGKVKLAFHIKTNEKFAVKIIKRTRFKGFQKTTSIADNENKETPNLGDLAGIDKEMKCLTEMNHKHVISLKEIIDAPECNKVYLVTEFLGGGTLA